MEPDNNLREYNCSSPAVKHDGEKQRYDLIPPACCIFFLLSYEARSTGEDDRP